MINTPSELRKITEKANNDDRLKVYHALFERHKKYIEKEMIRCAKIGQYYCWSGHIDYTFNTNPQVCVLGLPEYIKQKIITYFGDAWGYDVAYNPENNCMRISWE